MVRFVKAGRMALCASSMSWPYEMMPMQGFTLIVHKRRSCHEAGCPGKCCSKPRAAAREPHAADGTGVARTPGRSPHGAEAALLAEEADARCSPGAATRKASITRRLPLLAWKGDAQLLGATHCSLRCNLTRVIGRRRRGVHRSPSLIARHMVPLAASVVARRNEVPRWWRSARRRITMTKVST
ncbi:hypothetical protein Dimus_009478 [Dionaea muscipula]